MILFENRRWFGMVSDAKKKFFDLLIECPDALISKPGGVEEAKIKTESKDKGKES
jgi:hypothetical protein